MLILQIKIKINIWVLTTNFIDLNINFSSNKQFGHLHLLQEAKYYKNLMNPQNLHCMFEQKQNRRSMFNSQVNSLNLKQSTSTRQYTQAKSQQNLHVLKLQSKALDLLKKMEHQKFQIYTLTEEAQALTNLCDQQKSYLRSVNIDMMKQQYQEEIQMLTKQQQKVLELIRNLKEQKQFSRKQKQQKVNTSRYENQLLTQKIQRALVKKQELLILINEKKSLKKDYQLVISQQQQKIDELRHVQRKVAISLKEIETLNNKFNQS